MSALRVCAREGCTTKLSALNPGPFCWVCIDNGRVIDDNEARCQICGTPFVPGSAAARYCGEECKSVARRKANRKADHRVGAS